MTEVTRDNIEPFDLFTTFMVWAPLVWQGLRAAWRNRNRYTGRARHRMGFLGTGRGQRAREIIFRLRLERQHPLSLRYPGLVR